MSQVGAGSNGGGLRHAFVLSTAAFALHLVWESVQCPIFFVHRAYDAGWGGMLLATVGDVGLTWLLYGVVALFSQRWRWASERWRGSQRGLLVVGAVTLGVGIEFYALAEQHWSYRDAMPVIPGVGVGLVPVLQLLLLIPLSVAVAERITPAA